jgi:uncharacterized protein (DUF2225 family)
MDSESPKTNQPNCDFSQVPSGDEKPTRKVLAFEYKPTECPCCGYLNKLRSVRKSLYVRKNEDIDTRPSDYFWNLTEFSELYPHHYQIQKCDSCSWAGDINYFNEPGRNGNISSKSFLAAVLAGTTTAPPSNHEKILEILGENTVCPTQTPVKIKQAIQIHILAIYNQLLVPDLEEKEPYHLARYLLRTAWLLRDMRLYKQYQSERYAVEQLLTNLQNLWPYVPRDEKGFLEKARANYLKALTSSRYIKTERSEIEMQLLISRISLQLGDLRKAQEIIGLAKSKVLNLERTTKTLKVPEEIKENEELVKQAEEKILEQKAELRRVKLSLEKTHRIYEIEFDKWQTTELTRAQELIAKHSNKAKAEILQLLNENNFDQQIIAIALPKKAKKGLLGLFNLGD